MKTILVTSRKGGAGKTTLVRSLAVAAVGREMKVAVADTDPQGSLTAWWNRRQAEAPVLVPIQGDLQQTVGALKKAKFDLLLIDTPPSTHPFVAELLAVANLALVPVRPSPDDIDAIGATLDVIEAAGKPFAMVISQAKPRSRLAVEALRLLAQHGKVAPSVIHDRSEHPSAAITGQTVTETEPNGKAAAEITELLQYALKQVRA